MKNKKLVATVASLCLVVVAVVAAVVGVFAAAQQKLGASVTVNYTAVNVSATVDLKTYGLKDRSGTHSFSSDSSYAQTIFNPTANSNVNENSDVTGAPIATATIETYEYGWESAAQTDDFIGFSVYEFKFTNYNQSKALNLSWTYTGTNLTEFCYTSSEALVIDEDDFTGTWTDKTGALVATTSNFVAQTSGSSPASPTALTPATGTYSTSVSASASPSVIYVYVVLALSNANNTAGTAQINFTLASANA